MREKRSMRRRWSLVDEIWGDVRRKRGQVASGVVKRMGKKKRSLSEWGFLAQPALSRTINVINLR